MTTSKFRLNWLAKRRDKLVNKTNTAFVKVKGELVEFINSFEGKPDSLIKFLATCTQTDDVMTFVKMLSGAIDDAKRFKGDAMAKHTYLICSTILLKLHFLSHFTIPYSNVRVQCNKCKHTVKTNFYYTDKLCPYCGHIIL